MRIANAQPERNVPESAGADSRDWNILRTVISAILLVGVTTKVLNVAEIVHGTGLLANRGLLLSVIAVETAVSVYLLFGNPVNAWRLTVITFGLFSAVSAYTIATEQACNCFGSWSSPRFILVLDLAVLVSAAMVRPRPNQEPSFRLEGMTMLTCIITASIVVSTAWALEQSSDLHDPIQFLLADQLAGQKWPLDSRYHESLRALESGRWMVVILRRDCEHCQQVVNAHFADPDRHRDRERTVVFVAGSNVWNFELDRISVNLNSTDTIVWTYRAPFVAAPAAFFLQDGIVMEAADGAGTGSFLDRILSDQRSANANSRAFTSACCHRTQVRHRGERWPSGSV
jgi:hypothetical protein